MARTNRTCTVTTQTPGLTTGVLLLDPTLPEEDKLDFLGGINWMWKWGKDVVYQ